MPPPLIRVWISSAAVSAVTGDAELHFPNETGGVLMGYWSSGSEAVVTDSIDGGPLAQRERTSFYPDSEFQARAIEEIHKRSKGSLTYLGDWHTHPRGRLALSPTDKATLRRIARTREARAGSPIMMLLAGDEQWSAAAWCLRGSGSLWRRLNVCQLVVYER